MWRIKVFASLLVNELLNVSKELLFLDICIFSHVLQHNGDKIKLAVIWIPLLFKAYPLVKPILFMTIHIKPLMQKSKVESVKS